MGTKIPYRKSCRTHGTSPPPPITLLNGGITYPQTCFTQSVCSTDEIMTGGGKLSSLVESTLSAILSSTNPQELDPRVCSVKARAQFPEPWQVAYSEHHITMVLRRSRITDIFLVYLTTTQSSWELEPSDFLIELNIRRKWFSSVHSTCYERRWHDLRNTRKPQTRNTRRQQNLCECLTTTLEHRTLYIWITNTSVINIR
jgi:hypothetical protein